MWSAIAFAVLAVACSRTAEPEFEAENGTVVLRFEPPAQGMSAAVSGDGETAAVFDTDGRPAPRIREPPAVSVSRSRRAEAAAIQSRRGAPDAILAGR